MRLLVLNQAVFDDVFFLENHRELAIVSVVFSHRKPIEIMKHFKVSNILHLNFLMTGSTPTITVSLNCGSSEVFALKNQQWNAQHSVSLLNSSSLWFGYNLDVILIWLAQRA